MNILICSADNKLRARWLEGLEACLPVREADSLAALEGILSATAADIVLLHLTLPELRRGAGVLNLLKLYPGVRFMVFADRPHEGEGLALLKAGVRGYANSYMAPALLKKAVEVVQMGEVWVGRRLMQRLLSSLALPQAGQDYSGAMSALDGLTRREQEIAFLVAQGESNKGIANRLDITERTVKAHLTSVFQKTGVRDRLQLALLVNEQPPLAHVSGAGY